MLEIHLTRGFKTAQKKLSKADNELVKAVADKIARGEKLPEKHRDHALTGNLRGFRECHVKPDLLLLYGIKKKQLVLVLVNVGKHSAAFKK